MTTFTIVTNAILWFCIGMNIALLVRAEKLKKRMISSINYAKDAERNLNEITDKAVKAADKWNSECKVFSVEYRFSDSDYNKEKSKMLADAKNSTRNALGREITRFVGHEEIIENGLLVGYRLAAQVRKVEQESK